MSNTITNEQKLFELIKTNSPDQNELIWNHLVKSIQLLEGMSMQIPHLIHILTNNDKYKAFRENVYAVDQLTELDRSVTYYLFMDDFAYDTYISACNEYEENEGKTIEQHGIDALNEDSSNWEVYKHVESEGSVVIAQKVELHKNYIIISKEDYEYA